MRRAVFLFGVATLVATFLPRPALADGGRVPFKLGNLHCSFIPVPAAEGSAAVGTGSCPGVRPGGRVLSSVGDCTFNFLFRAPDGTRYIGTAGHCVSPGGASSSDSSPDGNARIERVWSWGGGPVAKDPAGHRIGEFAYAVVESPKDFALIRIDPAVEASPEMCHFGAPRGVDTAETSDAAVLHYYGNGQGIDTVLPARSAVALGTPNPDHVYAAGMALPGDSGAGVMTADGLALGVLVTFGLEGIEFRGGPDETPSPSDSQPADGYGVDLGTVGITRIGPQLVRASQQLGLPLELVTKG